MEASETPWFCSAGAVGVLALVQSRAKAPQDRNCRRLVFLGESAKIRKSSKPDQILVTARILLRVYGLRYALSLTTFTFCTAPI